MIKLLLLVLVSSCIHGQNYQDDFTSLPAYKANNPEFFVLLDNKACLDTAGNPGLCSLRVKENKDLELRILPRRYGYDFSLECSQSINESVTVYVPKRISYKHKIPFHKFQEVKSFICIGEIFPKDRAAAVSNRFEFRVKVVSKDYIPKERITFFEEYGLLYASVGENSLHVDVLDSGNWRRYYKKSVIRVSSRRVFILTESYNGNFGYYLGARER